MLWAHSGTDARGALCGRAGSDEVGEQDSGQDVASKGRDVLERSHVPVPLVHVEPFLRSVRCGIVDVIAGDADVADSRGRADVMIL
jgi:hypothetical protein